MRAGRRPEPAGRTGRRSRGRLQGLNNLAQEGEVCAAADGDNGLTDTNLQSVSGPEIGRVAHDDEPGELKIITGRQNQKASLCRRASGRKMLRLNLIAARNPGNDGARNERPRYKPGFLRVAPAPPSAAGDNLDAR